MRMTPAHQTDRFAELVCSNSLKSDQAPSASWLLKEELRRLGSFLVAAAYDTRVPGGQALTVDRESFSEQVTRAIESHPLIEVRREEFRQIDPQAITIIASGPLTSDTLAAEIGRITGTGRLYFYDSISPIVDACTVDESIAFRASRYDKSLDGTGDYLNCPFDKQTSTTVFTRHWWRRRLSTRTFPRMFRTSNPAFLSKRLRGEGATRCGSVR